jgi:hypothetical protein
MNKEILALMGAGILALPAYAVPAGTSRRSARSSTRSGVAARNRGTAGRSRAGGRRTTNRGAFSPVPLPNKQALLHQLHTDARFRRNLARHFGVSETELVQYVEQNLTYYQLPRTVRTGVYGVSQSGRSFRVVQRLQKGTGVYALAGGYSVIKAACGNAIPPTLPPVGRSVKQPGFPIFPPGMAAEFGPELAGGGPLAPGTIPFTSPLPPGPGEALFIPETFELASAPLLVPAGMSPFVPVGGHPPFFFIPPFWIPGGGGSTAFGAGTLLRPPLPPALIPEPGSLVLLGAGLLPFLALVKRRRRPELRILRAEA